MAATNAVQVGDRVLLERTGLVGIARFVGPTRFAAGTWIGVELPVPRGKNDGTVDGSRYFQCEAGFGIFVRPVHCIKLRAGRGTGEKSTSGLDALAKTAAGGSRTGSQRQLAVTEEVEPGLELNTVHEDLFSAAVDFENAKFLRILVEEDGIPLVGTDGTGNTVLHHVANSGGGMKAVKVLEYLIQRGMDKHIHARNIHGQTPVMLAAKNRRWIEVEYLVGMGSDVISKGHQNSQPSVWDSCHNFPQGEQALESGIAQQRKNRENGKVTIPRMKHKMQLLVDAVFKTAHAGDLTYVRMLLEDYGVDPNAQDKQGNTALHWIVSDPKRLPLVRYLVAEGARFNIRNHNGDTPCLIAARSRSWPVMQYLVSIGANVSEKDEKGKSVFKYAQVTLYARKALQDGLAEKKENNLTQVESVSHQNANRAGSNGAVDSDTTSNDIVRDVAGDEYVDGVAQETDQAEEEEDAGDDDGDNSNRQSEAASPSHGSRASPASPVASNPDGYANKEEVLAEIQSNQNPPPPPDAGSSTYVFAGNVLGKKKDKSKAKTCKVVISDKSLQLQYKKGAWYSRKDMADVYPWSDAMIMRRIDDETLQIVLDAHNAETLRISPCNADALEDIVWKFIWRSVFEASAQETKQLSVQYEKYCEETVNLITSRIDNQERIRELRRHAELEQDTAKVAQLSKQMAAIDAELAQFISRFEKIRNQGETMITTCETLYDALKRRFDSEEERRKQLNGRKQFEKAGAVKKEMDHIQAQMERVESEKESVSRLYEAMKQAELQYRYFAYEE